MEIIRLKILLLVCVLGLATSVKSQDPPPPVYRLPSTITPIKYMIRLDPNLDSGVIDGIIITEFNTTSDESQKLTSITLHLGTNVTINVENAALVDTNGVIVEIGAIVYDDPNTLLIIKLPEGNTLQHSHIYALNLQFQSFLNSEPKGLFSGYINSTSKYIASNFRPTHAREVFPCFDEPQIKVPITLQVWRPSSYNAISTAPLTYSSAVNPSNMVLDTFDSTEPISIHSLGLFVSELPSVTSMGVNVTVPSNLPTSVSYLDTLLSGITTRFGPFPTTPLNLVVLPDRVFTSFSSLGFVFTSPEVYLEEVGSALQWTHLKLQLTEEILRQFLEFSKTPQWWSDIWLSESVGAYLALPFQLDEPWLSDWLKIMVRSKALGGYNSSTGPVISGEQLLKWDIENIIANHSVKLKGLSTLIMWTDTMPEGLVAKTLSDFLKLPQSVVSTGDLVTLMVANIKANTTYDVTPAIDLLPNWLASPGIPLVWFFVDSTNLTFTLDQGTSCPAGSPASALRPISVAIAEGNDPNFNYFRQGRWLLNASTQYLFSSQLPLSSVLNIESAPFRVNYEESHWKYLTQALLSGWKGPASVASTLQDDAIALSLSGCLDFSTALSVLNSSQHSSFDWYPVVKAADAITAEIGNDWYSFTAFRSYFASLFSAELLANLDVRKSSSSPDLQVARELVTPWLCHFNIGTCREAVVELAGPLWLGNSSGIAGSDIANVACYGARYTPGALDALLAAYQRADNVWLRHYYTVALSCLTDQPSVQSLLGNFVNELPVLSAADSSKVLIGLASSLENSDAVMNFLLQQPLEIESRFGVSTVSTVIRNLAKYRVDLSKLNSLQDGTVDLFPYVLQSLDEALATSNASQAWWTDFSTELLAALPPGEPGTTTTSPTTPTTTTTTPTTPVTSSTPKPSPTPTPTPGGASPIYDYRVFTLVLAALLITLDVTLR